MKSPVKLDDKPFSLVFMGFCQSTVPLSENAVNKPPSVIAVNPNDAGVRGAITSPASTVCQFLYPSSSAALRKSAGKSIKMYTNIDRKLSFLYILLNFLYDLSAGSNLMHTGLQYCIRFLSVQRSHGLALQDRRTGR